MAFQAEARLGISLPSWSYVSRVSKIMSLAPLAPADVLDAPPPQAASRAERLTAPPAAAARRRNWRRSRRGKRSSLTFAFPPKSSNRGAQPAPEVLDVLQGQPPGGRRVAAHDGLHEAAVVVGSRRRARHPEAQVPEAHRQHVDVLVRAREMHVAARVGDGVVEALVAVE